MRIRNKKKYYLKRFKAELDSEGGQHESFSTEAIPIEANIYPASGKLQQEMYGARLNYMLNMLCDNDIEFSEKDGICVNVGGNSAPDYRIVSIKKFSHMFVELEKI